MISKQTIIFQNLWESSQETIKYILINFWSKFTSFDFLKRNYIKKREKKPKKWEIKYDMINSVEI